MNSITLTAVDQVPDEFIAAARSLRSAVIWESNEAVEIIARALMAAASAADQAATLRERGECAAIAKAANERYAAEQRAAWARKDMFKARDFESMHIAASGLADAIRARG